ncbi:MULTISPECIES: hypothetical protein [Nostoc]|uniref:Uncharacterized protein n=1 Tax=Nostoc paludosum FACHB-159 TaxID=2692908 RepID=A0ABR8K923_9NOSO|nr:MULTISPECIES: hypothetical protein [Nostoc]MBD2678977.1 hypothetical protein [Nostoc sp. FACHB-857]MBD2735356.1 hypothetical protein [Nostoc paludosum FACHB-159]
MGHWALGKGEKKDPLLPFPKALPSPHCPFLKAKNPLSRIGKTNTGLRG